jgi:hypothetical protein
VGVFGNFSCFPDDAGMVGLNVVYDFCSVKVDAVSSCCRVFGLLLVFQSGVFKVF